MYAFFSGILRKKTPSEIILEVQGIGYKIAIPLNIYTLLPDLSKPITLYTAYVVRELSQSLYGFLKEEDKDLFEKLINITGIGPKTALSILGHFEKETFQTAIINHDIQLISKVPGIGKKTAERLLVELKDLFKGAIFKESVNFVACSSTLLEDALQALIHLGYAPKEAQKALDKTYKNLNEKENNDLATIIKAALANV